MVLTGWMKNLLCYTTYQQNDGVHYLATVKLAYKELAASLYPKHALSQSLWHDSYLPVTTLHLRWLPNLEASRSYSYQKYLPACQKLTRGVRQCVLDSGGKHPHGCYCAAHLHAHDNHPYGKLEMYYLQTDNREYHLVVPLRTICLRP